MTRWLPWIWLACVSCSSREEAQGVLPNAQRAGEIARGSPPGRAFLALYPDAVVEAAHDVCPDEIGRGRACGGAEHYDVTFTHTDAGTPPRVTELAVEVGRGDEVIGTVPSTLLVYDAAACVSDEDCTCAECTACFNDLHAPLKIAAEAQGCASVACAQNGCTCRGGKCRTR